LLRSSGTGKTQSNGGEGGEKVRNGLHSSSTFGSSIPPSPSEIASSSESQESESVLVLLGVVGGDGGIRDGGVGNRSIPSSGNLAGTENDSAGLGGSVSSCASEACVFDIIASGVSASVAGTTELDICTGSEGSGFLVFILTVFR